MDFERLEDHGCLARHNVCIDQASACFEVCASLPYHVEPLMFTGTCLLTLTCIAVGSRVNTTCYDCPEEDHPAAKDGIDHSSLLMCYCRTASSPLTNA